MNRNMLKAAALSLPLVFGTAVADDAVDPLRVAGGIGATSISDVELGTVYGGFPGYKKYGHKGDACAYCALNNYAHVSQINASALSAFVIQGNGSSVNQSNN